jgi:hypothetical protein
VICISGNESFLVVSIPEEVSEDRVIIILLAGKKQASESPLFISCPHVNVAFNEKKIDHHRLIHNFYKEIVHSGQDQ